MAGNQISRRSFLVNSSKAALGVSIVPRHVLGGAGYVAPSDTLNLAIIGAGGMGLENARQLVSENIVALCDVDFGYVDRRLASRLEDTRKREPDSEEEAREKREELASLEKLQAAYASAERFADFRVMLERRKDIDAVVVATPDHLHAVIANAAMQLGKHVYVQKPLTYSVHEARVLRETAKRTGVVTQMGNQGHSSDDARRINEWIRAGVIGPVHEVHVWTNRPIWPQGVPRPAAQAEAKAADSGWGRSAVRDVLASALAGDYPAPPGLNWDLFLGPAPEVPYHPIYHPFNWRGWTDWGVGALGDMGAHLIDHPYWALELTYPSSIEATSTPFGGSRDAPASYPLATTVHYRFPARGAQPPVTLSWYDGGLMPPRPELVPYDVELSRTGGVVFIGEKGVLLHDTYGRNPRVLPATLMEEAVQVPHTFPRIEETHEMNWVLACKGQGAPTSPFDYAAPLTEVMLLGLVALRAGQGRKIYYDPQAMEVTNAPEANAYLKREYRQGWSL